MNNMNDFGNVNEVFKKNMQICANIMQDASEGANAILRRNSEITQNSVAEIFNATKDISTSSNPEQAISKQQEYLRKAMDNTLSNTREMMDLLSKFSSDMISSLTKVSEYCQKEQKMRETSSSSNGSSSKK